MQAQSFNTYAYNVTESRSTDALVPSFNLQWDVSENSMLYASFSQGFKSGGFTAADDGEPGGVALGTLPCAPNPDFTLPSTCYDFTSPMTISNLTTKKWTPSKSAVSTRYSMAA